MDGDSPINFQRRDARMALVRELVNGMVPGVLDRIVLLNAVTDYGEARAGEAIDGLLKASDADTLDVVGARR